MTKPSKPAEIQKRAALLVVTLIQVGLLFLLTTLDIIKYTTADDTTIVALLSGAYGFPNAVSLNMNYLIGLPLSILFEVLPVVNWVTIYFYITIIGSFLIINYIIIVARDSKTTLFLWVKCIALIPVFLYFLGDFTFTVVSYCSAISSALCGFAYAELPHKKVWGGLSVLSGVNSALIRSDCMLTIVAIVFLITICRAIQLKRVLKETFILAAALGIVSAALPFISLQLEAQMPGQAEAREWGETRSAALDGSFLTWDEGQDAYRARGINENQYNAAVNAFYFDHDTVSLELFETMLAVNPVYNRYNFDFALLLSQLGQSLLLPSWQTGVTILAMLIAIACAGVSNRPARHRILLLSLLVVVIEAAFFFVKRTPSRVTIPHYVLLCVGSLMLADEETDGAGTSRLDRRLVSLRLLVSVVSGLAIGICMGYYWECPARSSQAFSDETTLVTDYLRQHNQALFLSSNPELFSIDLARPILDYPGSAGERWNLIGNWETYSYPYYELMRSYSVSNPESLLLESIDSEHILYITNMERPVPDYALALAEERSGRSLHFELVDQVQSTNPYAAARVWRLVSD